MGRLKHAETSALTELLGGRRVVVLTGAGCSTESGIPDYRGPETRRRARNPIRFQQFIGDAQMRRRYWARSALGWPRFLAATPNPAHRALAQMEADGTITGIITQNVDRLHQRAGSRRVVELHGSLAEVRCLGCGQSEARQSLQERLMALNPDWRFETVEIAPDGDAEVGGTDAFEPAGCQSCDGDLKPDVVFFGENVPRPVYDAATAMMSEAEALLVVGSSLAVYSGFRFVVMAEKQGIPVGFINLGQPQRGGEKADVFLDGHAGVYLPRLASALSPCPAPPEAAP